MSNLLLLVLAVVLLFTSLFFGLSYVRERRKMKMRFNKFDVNRSFLRKAQEQQMRISLTLVW
ncbi:TPA: small membrane protein [Klebsiella pneumoniae]